MNIQSIAYDERFNTATTELHDILIGMTIQFMRFYEQNESKQFNQFVFPFLSQDNTQIRNYYIVSLINIPDREIYNRLYIKLIDNQYLQEHQADEVISKMLRQYENLPLNRLTFFHYPDGIVENESQSESN